jgi:hypothetical protein
MSRHWLLLVQQSSGRQRVSRRQGPRELKERSGPLRRPIRRITEREKVKKEEVGEDKATTKVERKKTCVLAGESIYSRSGHPNRTVDNHYIIENLF